NTQLAITTKSLSATCGVRMILAICQTYYSVIRRSQLLLPKETMLQLSQLSDIQLRGVILMKYQLAAEHSVNITLSVDKLFDNTSIEKDIDFYRVVGILLDNAIEAVSPTTDKKVSIIFSKDNEIIIVNSYQENIDIHRIEELGYSSKNTHEGIGLSFITRYTMQQPLIEHCTIIENRQFIQKLIVG
ncbi:GHKL domain-containing protein, partial [Leuconostoc citreum]|uniref:GHKL domain-containing protein n=1 Tax=Leuconostoc citreum TaxID=33964 RepID=UPI0025A24877